MDIIAEASLASSLSNTGSPSPAGTLSIMHFTTAPEESLSAETFLRYSAAFSAASLSGIYSLLFEISFLSNLL